MLIRPMACFRICCIFKCSVSLLHKTVRLQPVQTWSNVGYFRLGRTLHWSSALWTHKYHPETDVFIKFTDEQSAGNGSETCPVELARNRLNEGLVICNGDVEFNGTLKDFDIPNECSKGDITCVFGYSNESDLPLFETSLGTEHRYIMRANSVCRIKSHALTDQSKTPLGNEKKGGLIREF